MLNYNLDDKIDNEYVEALNGIRQFASDLPCLPTNPKETEKIIDFIIESDVNDLWDMGGICFLRKVLEEKISCQN